MRYFIILTLSLFTVFASCTAKSVKKSDDETDSLKKVYINNGEFFYQIAIENGFERIARVHLGYKPNPKKAIDSTKIYLTKAFELDSLDVNTLFLKFKLLYLEESLDSASTLLESKPLKALTSKGFFPPYELISNQIKARKYDRDSNTEQCDSMLRRNVQICEEYLKLNSNQLKDITHDELTALTKGAEYFDIMRIYYFYLYSIDSDTAIKLINSYKKKYPNISGIFEGMKDMAASPEQWKKSFPM